MIKANNVSVTFKSGPFGKKISALSGFDISVKKGDVFALLGPNGAGKSTAMYCFLGLIKPNRGNIEVMGKEPVIGSSLFERIGYLPEEPHYHLYLSVEEAVRYYAALYHNKVSVTKINQVIDRVGLGGFKRLKLSKCSKGMKQKVGIASCLLNQPDLLFLDEPTRGLDPVMVKDFRDILLEMKQSGATIVINSHILSEVEMMCNHVAIINKGKVLVADELENLIKQNNERYAVEFEATDPVPDFINVDIKTNKIMKGFIDSDKVSEFLAFLSERNIKAFECNQQKVSLEDVFFKVLEKGGSNE